MLTPIFARGFTSGASSLPITQSFDTGECGSSKIELDSAVPRGPMADIKVQDQDGLGVCYAVSGTEMFDWWRKSHGGAADKSTTSFIAAAIQMKAQDHPNSSGIDGGDPCEIVDFLKKQGGCDQSKVFDGIETADQNSAPGNTRLRDYLGGLHEAIDQHASYLDDRAKFYAVYQQIQNSPLPESIYGGSGCPLPPLLKGQVLPDQKVMMKAVVDPSNPLFGINSVLDRSCSTKITAPNIPACTSDILKPLATGLDLRQRIQSIHSALQRGEPVGIGYCASILSEGRKAASKTAWGSMGQVTGEARSDCEPHASLVIGSRVENGKCQLRIRNSWGAECDSYSPDWKCDPNDRPGNVWVDADVLLNNTLRTFTLGK